MEKGLPLLYTPGKPPAQARLRSRLPAGLSSATSHSQPGEGGGGPGEAGAFFLHFQHPFLTTTGLMPLALTSRKRPESCKTTVRSPLVFITFQSSPSGFPSKGRSIRGWCGEQHHKLLGCDGNTATTAHARQQRAQGGQQHAVVLGEGKGKRTWGKHLPVKPRAGHNHGKPKAVKERWRSVAVPR